MPEQVEIDFFSLQGKRSNNEDFAGFLNTSEYVLAVVADGMGGQASGEVASKEAVDFLINEIQTGLSNIPLDEAATIEFLINAIVEANKLLVILAATETKLFNMGTTLVVFLQRKGMEKTIVANLGDSRAYIWRNGKLNCLTKDHTIAQALLDAGSITPAQAAIHPFRNRLWKFLGSKDRDIAPDIFTTDIWPGDRFLLCTDGLSGTINSGVLGQELSHPAIAGLCKRLCHMAIEEGSQDNTTSLIIAHG